MDVTLVFLTLLVIAMLLGKYAPVPSGVVQVEEIPAAPAGGLAAPPEQDAVAGPVVKAGAPVRFLMQNVQNYFVEGEAQRSRYRNPIKKVADREAVADVIASAAPEIVGLVEIGGPKALDDLAARLEARGLVYPYRFVLTRDGEDRALAILSMHPIVRNDSKANYGLYGTHNRKMLRGILDVTIRMEDGREFRVIGAHLKSHRADSEAAAANLRAKEARTLAIYIQQIMKVNPNIPIVVYGDWNDGPADDSLRILRQGISKDSALTRLKPADDNGEEWTHHYRDGGLYLTYDQIYVNAPLRSRMGRKSKSGVVGGKPGKAYGSDHRAVWCELR